MSADAPASTAAAASTRRPRAGVQRRGRRGRGVGGPAAGATAARAAPRVRFFHHRRTAIPMAPPGASISRSTSRRSPGRRQRAASRMLRLRDTARTPATQLALTLARLLKLPHVAVSSRRSGRRRRRCAARLEQPSGHAVSVLPRPSCSADDRLRPVADRSRASTAVRTLPFEAPAWRSTCWRRDTESASIWARGRFAARDAPPGGRQASLTTHPLAAAPAIAEPACDDAPADARAATASALVRRSASRLTRLAGGGPAILDRLAVSDRRRRRSRIGRSIRCR
jgi:hypothetical protein